MCSVTGQWLMMMCVCCSEYIQAIMSMQQDVQHVVMGAIQDVSHTTSVTTAFPTQLLIFPAFYSFLPPSFSLSPLPSPAYSTLPPSVTAHELRGPQYGGWRRLQRT